MKQIPVWKKGEIIAYTIVDDNDYDSLSQYKWYMDTNRHIRRTIGPKNKRINIYIHREIMGLEYGNERQVDHKDQDPLNNVRSNLRYSTNALNRQNVGSNKNSSSEYRGVAFHKGTRKWQANVQINGKAHYLGIYADEKEAAKVASDFRKDHMEFSYV